MRTPLPRRALPAALLALAACAAPTENPADGGFVSGVGNLADGTYERRVREREVKVAAAETEGRALAAEKAEVAAETARVEAEIAAAEGDLAAAKREVLRLRYALRDRGRPVPPEIEAKVVAATTAAPAGPDPAAKLAALRKAIADTRALAEDLAKLSG